MLKTLHNNPIDVIASVWIVITLLLVILKALGILTWHWLWILLPFIAGSAIIAVFAAVWILYATFVLNR